MTPPKKKTPKRARSWPYNRRERKMIREQYERMCQGGLANKESGKIGRTRRGRKKGNTSKSGIVRWHKPFPYPKRGKHRVVDGRTVPANA